MDLKSLFKHQIFWRNLVGAYCVGLDRFAPVAMVLCSDHGLELDLIAEDSQIRFFTLEERTLTRLAPSGHQADSSQPRDATEARLIGYLERLPRDRFAIACPVPSRLMEAFVEAKGFASAVVPFDVTDWLGEKKNWFTGLDLLGLPRLDGRWMCLASANYSELAASYGPVFVAQLSRGVSGSGTSVIASDADYRNAAERFAAEPAWIAPYLEGPSLAVNAAAIDGGSIVGYPSVQLVGLEECRARPGEFCGSDYHATAAMPASLIEQVQEQTGRIADWIGAIGFRGVFGVDFVADAELRAAYAVDLNPRWLGSTALLAQAEQAAGRVPLAALDLAVRLGALSPGEALALGEKCREPLQASQLVLYSAAPGWIEVTAAPRAGVYSFDAEAVEFVRSGVRLSDLAAEGELLLTAGVPRAGLRVQPSSHLLRIYSRQPLLDPGDTRRLLPWCAAACARTYASVEHQPASLETPAAQSAG